MAAARWSAFISDPFPRTIAREVASRLQDRERLTQAIALAPHQTHYPFLAEWQATSLPCGNAGLAVLFAALDRCFPDEGWDQAGHAQLRLAAQDLSERSLDSSGFGLFGGVCGVAFAAWLLSRGGTRYQHLLATLEGAITTHLFRRAALILEQGHGCASSQFDVIFGLAGSGAYLLCRHSHPRVAEALRAVLQALIFLSEEEEGLPHWYTPPAQIMQSSWVGRYPDGLLDCGLAHGIAGPLALQALAKLQGVEVEGMEAAILRMGTWLVEHHITDAWGVNWLDAYPTGPQENVQSPLLPSRTAWCYGAPGIARALWLAGEALHQEAFCSLAIASMEAVYRKPLADRDVDAPTFCHGVAGLLQITLRFAHETGLPLFYEAAQSLTEQLVALYEPESLLGFRDLEPGALRVDQAGLLTGAPGAAMVLLAASTACEPIWDRLFLLS